VSPRTTRRARCRGCTPYGAGVAAGITSRAGHGHTEFVSATCWLARYAAGGEIPWPTYEQLALNIGRNLGREDEAHKIIRYCRRHGEADPRRAPTDGQVPFRGTDIVIALVRWRDAAHARRPSGTVAKVIDALFVDAVARAAVVKSRRPSGAWDVNLSQRQLAEAAGVSRSTIESNLSAIAKHVGVRRSSTGSTIWRIPVTVEPSPGIGPLSGSNPAPQGHGPIPGLTPPRSALPVSLPGANAWVKNGNAYRVWLALDLVDAVKPRDLAMLLGLGRSTVFAILGRLANDGLARSTPDGWVRVDGEEPPSPDFAAERRARHEAERALWRQARGIRSLDDEIADLPSATTEIRRSP